MLTLRTTVNNLDVSFIQKEANSPSATIVFIHGFPLGKEIWLEQLKALPEDVQGIAYDIRGYGESDAGHGFFNIELFVHDLINFINHLTLQKVILCGVSMGGYIALRAFELEPSLFSGLILCDTNASADTNASKINRFASIEKIQGEGKGAFANEFLKKMFSEKTEEEHPELVNALYKMIMDLPHGILCATQLALASRTDTSDVLGSINVPTLVIRGAEDKLMSAEHAEALRNGIPGAKFVEIPGAGHLPNLESPEAFNQELVRFCRRY